MKAFCAVLFAGIVGCALVQPGRAIGATKFQEKVVWSFGGETDGQYPIASLIYVNGILYGTTGGGGAYGQGTVFALDTSTGAEKVLYSFCGQNNCADGALPEASLVDINGVLYGTTLAGGDTGCGGQGCGTVFSLNENTDTETVLYSFCAMQNCADGEGPPANLIYVQGTFYGTTQDGGASDWGTVFALDRSTGAETVLYSFCSQRNCLDGLIPDAALINVNSFVNGLLYGTTEVGGNGTLCQPACSGGTVFSLDASTGAEKVVYSFCSQKDCADGESPFAGLVNVNGILYGTTGYGGAENYGTVFAINPDTGAERVLFSFCSQNDTGASSPVGGLIDAGGTLYGTTSGSGCRGGGDGTVFSIDPETGAETVIYSFAGGTDGQNPGARLIDVSGTLYGTTEYGGAYGSGTLFALTKEN